MPHRRHSVCEARQRGQLSRGRLVGVAMGDSVASSAHDCPHVGPALDQAFGLPGQARPASRADALADGVHARPAGRRVPDNARLRFTVAVGESPITYQEGTRIDLAAGLPCAPETIVAAWVGGMSDELARPRPRGVSGSVLHVSEAREGCGQG